MSSVRTLAAVVFALAVGSYSTTVPFAQNQTPSSPTPGRGAGGNQTPAGNQTGRGPANQTPAKPAEPPPTPGAPLYISPGIVKMIQEKLIAMGYPMPTTSGAWGDNSA